MDNKELESFEEEHLSKPTQPHLHGVTGTNPGP